MDFVNIREMEDLDCVRKRMSADFKKLAKGQWSRNRLIEQEWEAAGLNLSASQPDCPEDYFCLMLTTRSPLDPKIYNRQLQNYNEVLTESIIKGWISTELSTCKQKGFNSSVINQQIEYDNRATTDKTIPW